MRLLGLHCYLFFLVATTISCNRYVDKATVVRKTTIYQGSFNFYPDSNVLFYKNKIGVIRGHGTEGKDHKPYYIKPPKRLIWWTVGADSFVFNYKDKQVIAFYMDLFDDIKLRDTAYIPTIKDIERFPPRFTVERKKYALWNIPMIKDRKHYLINKGEAIILLYNIKPSNFDRFIEAANSFKFL